MSTGIKVAPDPLRAERALTGAFRRLRGHGGFICVTAGAAIAGIATIPGAWWLVIPATLAAALGVIMHVRLDPTYSDLAHREESATIQAAATAAALQSALESILRRISTHCQANESHQRISIYCHVEDEFVTLARESTSTVLSAPGRGIYPDHSGVIGEAWDIGESLRGRWPEDRGEWEELQQRVYGISADVASALRMQARSIVALRLSHDAIHVGVIVMESTQPRGVMRRHLTAAKDSLLLESACEILLSAQPHFPAVAEHVKRRTLAKASD